MQEEQKFHVLIICYLIVEIHDRHVCRFARKLQPLNTFLSTYHVANVIKTGRKFKKYGLYFIDALK
jgi:hypothetical protein